jgi:hypothetical protein
MGQEFVADGGLAQLDQNSRWFQYEATKSVIIGATFHRHFARAVSDLVGFLAEMGEASRCSTLRVVLIRCMVLFFPIVVDVPIVRQLSEHTQDFASDSFFI